MTINKDFLDYCINTKKAVRGYRDGQKFEIPKESILALCNFVIQAHEKGEVPQEPAKEPIHLPDVGPDDFLMPDDVELLNTIKTMSENGQEVNMTSLKEESRKHNTLVGYLVKRLERYGYIFIHDSETSNAKLVELVRMPSK